MKQKSFVKKFPVVAVLVFLDNLSFVYQTLCNFLSVCTFSTFNQLETFDKLLTEVFCRPTKETL